jgi:hypothetical protein
MEMMRRRRRRRRSSSARAMMVPAFVKPSLDRTERESERE